MVRLIVIVISITYITTVYSDSLENCISIGNKYWENRDQLESLEKAIVYYKKVVELKPDDHKLILRLSYACFLNGWELKDISGNKYKEKRKALFTSGMKYAEKVLDVSPENTMAGFRYIMNKLMYRREFSIISSARMVPEVRERMNNIMEKEKFIDTGGPQRVMANLIMEVPGFLRSSFSLGNLGDAEKLLKEAIAFDSEFILNYVTLADVYMKQKKKKEAKEQLQIAIDTPINPEHAYAAENRRDKKVSIRKMQEYFGK